MPASESSLSRCPCLRSTCHYAFRVSTYAPSGPALDEPFDETGDEEWDDLEIAEDWERLCSPLTRRVLALALSALSDAAS